MISPGYRAWTGPRLGRDDTEYRLKRPLDVVVAVIALLLTAPLWVLVALAVKLTDGGPVFYSQRRWGQGGRHIRVLKFRTMIPDADLRFGPMQARDDDVRITRVGRLLRATSLDELPQILSILAGEMSWVGPRALAINEIQAREAERGTADDDIPGFAVRSRLRPGLTGLAQIYAPRDIVRRNKFKYDVVYAQHQSLWLDSKLILLSVWISITARWGRGQRRSPVPARASRRRSSRSETGVSRA